MELSVPLLARLNTCVTFAGNRQPAQSSHLWLLVGSIGPRRVAAVKHQTVTWGGQRCANGRGTAGTTATWRTQLPLTPDAMQRDPCAEADTLVVTAVDWQQAFGI